MTSPYRKATASQGASNCAEIGTYRKASFSGYHNSCVEAGQGEQVVGVRDTKQEHLGDARTVLEFSTGAWNRFLNTLKD